MAFSRSPLMACAVSPITGTLLVATSALTRRVASQPSMTGKLMSMRMMSGFSLFARSTPCCPSTAKITSKPRRMRRRDSISRFISLSSTSRTFAIGRPSPVFLYARTQWRACGSSPYRRADRRGNIQPRRAALLDDLLCLPQQALALSRRELLCGEDDHRNVAPFCPRSECVENLKTVHFRHHQVEQDHRRGRMRAEPG